ncbi:protein SULFUR DEFICIENCY-INDUCED 1 isoform X1 [Lathyrus oleraceus]|nr:protein SULFUR DEFICIENCY-INDUCED 1-like isoform X1 [Pisum sativum]
MEGVSVLKKSSNRKKHDLYHVIHKVPFGDSPCVKAKHAQKCGIVEEQIDLSKRKLKLIYQGDDFNGRITNTSYSKLIYQGDDFNGKTTNTSRSNGKKFQVSINQETARLLGNKGWTYMQKTNYMMAGVIFKEAQMLDADANNALNLALCLIRQSRYEEAYLIIEEVLQGKLQGSDEIKFINKAEELLTELNANLPQPKFMDDLGLDDDLVKEIDGSLNVWSHIRSRRLPIFEEISSFRDN